MPELRLSGRRSRTAMDSLLILARAGSGKTRVLPTHRLPDLHRPAQSQRDPPRFTFPNNGEEMSGRVVQLLGRATRSCG